MRGARATVTVALVAGCTLAAGAVGVAGSPSSKGVGLPVHAVPTPLDRSISYWTPARMRQASPIGRMAPLAAGPASHGGADPGANAVPSFVPPAGPAASGAPARLLPGRPAAATASAFSPGDERVFPNRVHGKVFFTYPGRGDFACSGTVVNSAGRSLVITAGHCVHEGTWATNWVFVPGYRDGRAPFGEWPARTLRAPAPWIASENISFDIGAATVDRNREGRGLQNVVGARGIGFDQPRDQSYESFGYPAELPFDGERLFACRSRWQGDDASTDPPRTMSIDCDMNAGSSGGGWVADGLVLSLNSYCPGILTCVGSSTLFGPYFGDLARGLYHRSQGRLARCSGRPVTQLGTRGSDSFTGGRHRDSIGLGQGSDAGAGRAGDDRICGGPGDDTLRGGPGFDVCDGGPGTDSARGCEVRRQVP